MIYCIRYGSWVCSMHHRKYPHCGDVWACLTSVGMLSRASSHIVGFWGACLSLLIVIRTGTLL